MVTGEIVRLVRDRGFGFIRRDGFDAELFFHASSVDENFAFDDLEVGMRVGFAPAQGPKGPRAERIEVLALAGDGEDGSHAVADPHHGGRLR